MSTSTQKKLQWKTMGRRCICTTRVMSLHMQTALSPDGSQGEYLVMDAPDWVITVPFLDASQAAALYGLQKPCFLLVEQWRHGASEMSIEFPGGIIDKGESPEAAAKRELLEETGFNAGNLIKLGAMSPNPAIFSNKVHFFAASTLTPTGKQDLDSDEFLRTFPRSLSEVYKKMGQPPYIHALMGTALELYRQKMSPA